MQRKWLIAVDLDGTLFHTDHQVSSRTLSTMHRVAEHGHSIVVITGRTLHSAAPRLQSMPDGIRMVCSNGAYEYDRENNAIVWANTLPADDAVVIKQRILNILPAACFGWETVLGLSYDASFITLAGGADTLEQSGSPEAFAQRDLLKLFVRTPTQSGNEVGQILKPLLGGAAEVSSSGAPFAEITATGSDKGNALAKIASNLGFTADQTMAFGDNHNDISMLQWAGESVAMGNAEPEVISMAKSVALSNAEHGVAQYLEGRFDWT